MDYEDDDLFFSPTEEARSPILQAKFRRLKKAARASSPPAVESLDPTQSTSLDVSPSDSINGAELMDARKAFDLNNSTDRNLLAPGSEGLDEGRGKDDRLDDLFSYEGRSGAENKSDLEMESGLGDLDRKGHTEGVDLHDSLDDLKMEKSKKKKHVSDQGNERAKKKKKREQGTGDDGKPRETAQKRSQLEKERKVYLDLIHAQSQRLLRETRDVSFKPIPLVQKPISSVLEKIRLRKLEVSIMSGISNDSACLAETKTSPRDTTKKYEPQHAESNNKRDFNDVDDDDHVCLVNPESDDVNAAHVRLDVPDLLCHNESEHSKSDNLQGLVGNSQEASQTSADNTQDLCNEYQQNDAEDNQPECPGKGLKEDGFTQSSLVMLLKLDNGHLEDSSSDEESDEKENIDPHPPKLDDLFTKSDPVKAFVDDEAEEEDDSDNDLIRFRENEEDEENEENEELDDLIVTGYKEMPIDSEKRDELHQKWLEQQDAAATDNVLQRLKCGWKQREQTLLQEEEEDEFSEHSMEETMDDLCTTNMAQKNSRKVKQMIAQMFTDKDDGFVSSDDEEKERLVRQRLLEQTEEQASMLSPAEDENSREVFGRIKKLNIAPTTKKRAKTMPSFFDTLILGGNSNSSSKSSFVGRVSSSSLPSSHKQGSSMVRSFVFGRDDSNSRSSMSTSGNSSNMDKKENQPIRNASVKLSMSQTKSTAHNVKGDKKDSSGPSLFEILRQSSTHSNGQNHIKTQNGSYGIDKSQAAKHFAAFVSTKRTIKVERS